MAQIVSVFLVEDDPDFAYLIIKMINSDDRLRFIGHASDRPSSVEQVQKLAPDIVVMDLNLSWSELDGIEAAREIRLTTHAKILFLTSFEQPEIILNASKNAFASGYVFKSHCQTLTDTIYRTATSDSPQELFIRELLLATLSPAERAIFNDLVDGDADPQSSSSLKTVANQKTSIFRKLGASDRREAVRRARDLSLLLSPGTPLAVHPR